MNKNQLGSFIKPSQLKKMKQKQQSVQTQNEQGREQSNQEVNFLIQQSDVIKKTYK